MNHTKLHRLNPQDGARATIHLRTNTPMLGPSNHLQIEQDIISYQSAISGGCHPV